MNRIQQLFNKKRKNIFSVYFTAGFPKLNDTLNILETLQADGIDMAEVGIPFSDPMADGVVIQQSSQKALENGMNLRLLFSQLAAARPKIHIPLVMMSYLNPIMQFGFENFCRQCSIAGADGMIIPDLPMADYLAQYRKIAEKYDLKFIFLITPETSEERIRQIDDNTDGFIYMVSAAAVTGVQNSFDSQIEYFERINAMNLKNPRLVGFGISNRQTLETANKYSSGAIIGSAFIKAQMETENAGEAVKLLTEKLK